MMENSDEFVCSNDQSQILVKGKRTKRQRTPSPCDGGAPQGDQNSSIYSSSPTSSAHDFVYDSTEEDEDMANCLILLAQGDQGMARKVEKDCEVKVERFGGSSKKFMETVKTSEGKAGFYVYECKTCNRSFPSFQALGGHRASHKKPKMMMMNLVADRKIDQELAPPHPTKDEEIVLEKIMNSCPSVSPPSLSLRMVSKRSVQFVQSTKANKTHECSICGAEFSSGQALGGHMRRHRAPPPPTGATAQISLSSSTTSSTLPEEGHDEKPRNILALDLNLPAPEDDQRDTKFQFVTPQQSLVFPSPTLVDCHN